MTKSDNSDGTIGSIAWGGRGVSRARADRMARVSLPLNGMSPVHMR